MNKGRRIGLKMKGGIPKVAIKKEHNLKDYKIELVGDTVAYIYHCKENNMNDAIEKAIAHHKINKNDIINIYVTEGYWRKATAEDFKDGE